MGGANLKLIKVKAKNAKEGEGGNCCRCFNKKKNLKYEIDMSKDGDKDLEISLNTSVAAR